MGFKFIKLFGVKPKKLDRSGKSWIVQDKIVSFLESWTSWRKAGPVQDKLVGLLEKLDWSGKNWTSPGQDKRFTEKARPVGEKLDRSIIFFLSYLDLQAYLSY